ncbi:BAAT / Acyl-CoA thioester hydrolase C terminal [Saccharicrinis carchari]|uniref:BAAT / Acyl-CoA thioester hydrolase C terminal n=1 Tax=Saccharicrinis carchari TaxID=1168039 RepID=A0A521AES2_SACCC|nr:acyl-CoA thioester hydrolase/BAAT C-terminal domain-containing protein [Saccharicrinis carchari]SMO33279.1 BAAT / Acyl-CoA thioester hydrolase C terminal [Saccharicrinis carchari]
MIKYRKYIAGIGILSILLVGYFITDRILFDGIKPRGILNKGFQANYFAEDSAERTVCIVLVGGGAWGDYWGQLFAQSGYVGLSLPYTGREGLPRLPEEIDLEYFENAIKWLKLQAEVKPDKIVVMGASRNAELALVIASTYPELVSGVIAYAPSSVAWSNTVLPYSSDEIKSSWRHSGSDIPYVPMNKISGNPSNRIELIDYWKSGLAKTDDVSRAAIRVENINGPILLLSGKDDMVWPSALMADSIEKRIKDSNYPFTFENIQYENAGHLISSNPDVASTVRTGKINIAGKNYEFEYGGTIEGDQKARLNAKKKVLDYIRKL